MVSQHARSDPALSRTPSAPSPHPLLAVLCWELRRVLASRVTWVMAAGTFGVFIALMVLLRWRDNLFTLSTPQGTLSFHYPATSVWGLIVTYPQSPGMFLGLLLPFVCADGIARDLKRRTHELVMATSLPSWAYVWGRYLASLCFSLVLAGMILLAIVVVTVLLHLVDSGVYPPTVLSSILAVWTVVVLPPTLLLSGLSFSLGALLPRRANLVRLGVVLAWFTCGASFWYLVNPNYRDPNASPSPYVTWDPTSIAPTFPLERQFVTRVTEAAQTLDIPAVLRYERTLQQTMPDLSAWIAPHLVWAAIGIAAVGIASLTFRRFRGAGS
jgi:ABC-type transport system involved in multi-copper enzyme maturation permease subunit